MGGLVVRSYLLKNRIVSANTRFLYFLSTPTGGSFAANILSRFSPNPQIGKLKSPDSQDFLEDLVRQWLAAQLPIPTYCAYEKQKTNGVKVVEQVSAAQLCNRPLDPIDADHIEIAKPANRKASQYQAFANAFKENIISSNPQSSLSFQYGRLFGALEIPLLMDLLPDPGFGRSSMGQEYRSVRKRRDVVDDVQAKLARFVTNLPFSQTKPILTPIWHDIAGKASAASTIAWRASSGNRTEHICLLLEPLVDGGSQNNAEALGSLMPKNWPKACARAYPAHVYPYPACLKKFVHS